MPLSPEANLFINKVSEAVDYCMKESDVTVQDAIGGLEIIKLSLFHGMQHNCPRCGNQHICNHCGEKIS